MKEKNFGPIRFLYGEKNGRYPFCHSLFIDGAGVLIDPACNREGLIRIKENHHVKKIWLSHWHEDHIMFLDLFEDLPLFISEPDAPPLSDVELFLDAYGIIDEDFRSHWRQILRDQFHFRPRKPSRYLRGGETIQLGAVTADVIHTPGHTPGHLSFYFREPGILFMGDYDLTPFGPWYGDRDSSLEETIASVTRLRQIPARVWIACHEKGLFEEDPGAIWDRYLDVIWQREETLLRLLNKPRSVDDIINARIVYGKPREPQALFDFGEWAIMEKHLERLINKGIVSLKDENYSRVY